MQVTYSNVNRQKFVDELQVTGIDFNNVIINAIDDKRIGAVVTIINGDTAIKGRIDELAVVHDPTPIPPVPTMEEQLRLEMARSNAEMFEMMMDMLGGEM